MTPDATRDAEDSQADTRTRTHLANERTFLAWLQTGITAIALASPRLPSWRSRSSQAA